MWNKDTFERIMGWGFSDKEIASVNFVGEVSGIVVSVSSEKSIIRVYISPTKKPVRCTTVSEAIGYIMGAFLYGEEVTYYLLKHDGGMTL